ncbi:MAG: D-psicose/D-tagatose/L-ribulose 3-epimerase [Thermomicrobiales bacterium]|nr:D-psicose/D-tagatose/L-ribulose 3-epimerase [Thermomicrobiales bacterium]
MNTVGANTWIWVSPATDERLAELAPRIKGWGFDQIEIPVENPGDWDPVRTAELLSRLDLRVSVCCVMGAGRDFTVDDRATVEATRDYLRT